MFWNQKPTEDVKLADVVDNILTNMQNDPDSPEFANHLTNLERIEALRLAKRRPRVSPDTLVIAGCNLVGILIMLKHEKTEVITSKAINFIMKPK